MVMRIKGNQNKGRNNGNGSTKGTGKMEKDEIQTQTGKSREESGGQHNGGQWISRV
jgi:hypothetical protein